MRATKLLFAAALIAAALPAAAAIPWFKEDVDAAFKEAKLRKRPLLVYFHTTWCSWCVELEDKVFSKDDVADAMSAFVPLRLNCDRREGQKIMKRYGVSSFPTILVVTSGGEVLGRLGMFRPAPEFLGFLHECLTPGETLTAIDKRIETGDRSPDLLLRSASRHFDAGEFDAAADRYQQAIRAATAGGLGGVAVDARIGLGSVKSMTGDPDAALEQYRIILKNDPSSKRLAEAFVGAIVILKEQDRGGEIDLLFREYGDRFPDDPAVLNDYARRLLETKGDPVLALSRASRAAGISPSVPEYQETLARAQLAAGRPADAMEAVQRAIDLRPTDKELRVLRLEIMEAGRAETAMRQTSKPGAEKK